MCIHTDINSCVSALCKRARVLNGKVLKGTHVDSSLNNAPRTRQVTKNLSKTSDGNPSPGSYFRFTLQPLIESLPGCSHPLLHQPPLRMYRNIHFSDAWHNYSSLLSSLPGFMPAFPRRRSLRASPAVPVHPLMAGAGMIGAGMIRARATYGTWRISRFLVATVHNRIGSTTHLPAALTLPLL